MKSFGLGLLSGALLGAVIGFVKNPQTGNTIKHDFKQQIDETIADSNNIKEAKVRFDESSAYLKNDGEKLIDNTLSSITDRIDGFNQQIAPNLKGIEDSLQNLQDNLPQTTDEDQL